MRKKYEKKKKKKNRTHRPNQGKPPQKTHPNLEGHPRNWFPFGDFHRH
jgi:hypothetical protein